MGTDVILVDGDFGGANLHTALGLLEPEYTFFDFYTLQKENLNDIVLDTPVDNLRFISGACGTLGLANPKYFQKQRFMRELRKLDADHVILDLGAGSTYDVIDFFLLADEKIIVVTPEPTSIHEAFGFLKVCLLRELNRELKEHMHALNILNDERINKPGKTNLTVIDLLRKVHSVDAAAGEKMRKVLESFSPKLILNMVKDADEATEGMALKAAALELLGIHVDFLGFVSYDHAVKEAVKNMKPFLLYRPKCQAAQDLSALLRVSLMGKKGLKEILERRKWRKHVETFGKQYPTRDLAADAPICSMKCFYWGDCEYQSGGEPCRVRHLEPILVNNPTSD
jgi:flagellar biosynthesis protein FlhG